MMIADPKKVVLIIDDEDDVRSYLEMALEDAGYEVLTASDGNEGLTRLSEKTPDLISLDVVMPKGSGVKFYRELKKKPEWSAIPVIIVTGHARDELGKTDFTEMTMSGPGVYLEKPVTAVKYVEAVGTILGVGVKKTAGPDDGLKEELKSLIDKADPETLKEILKSIKGAS
ncbi:MAG TPA: response regulator [Spirochaetota bacterium]|nr:response regulator [Spirochaetota bacterium]